MHTMKPRWNAAAGAALLLAGALAPTLFMTTAHAGLRERLAERRAASEAAEVTQPGLHEQHIDHGGLKRSYLVQVPKGLDLNAPAPVVYVFHGGGGHAAFMTDDDRYHWLRESESGRFIAVFPSGYSKLPGGRFATWNAGGCCGDARDREVDDVGFVRAVHARLGQQFKLDAARVYATGMSNGGMMSHRLACDMADVFAAIGPVAGTDATDTCHPSRPVSVLHIHARDDTHVLFDGGAGPDAFRDASKVMDFVSVPDTLARWAQRDQCKPLAQPLTKAPGVSCEAYQGCAGGAQVQLCVTEQGGHSWPGTSARRMAKAQPSQALDATAAIWRFFQQAHR
jgi:polyhydroxybutyrate depolymerase